MVALSIVSVLVSIVYPYYKREVLLGRFEEAKLMIHKIALAQEKYYVEHGKYYFLPSSITNENLIASKLDVDLKVSNNFMYAVIKDDNGYKIKAMLRFNIGTCNNDIYYCKQLESPIRNNWVIEYNTAADNHALYFKYPNSYSTSKAEHFSYEYVYKGD